MENIYQKIKPYREKLKITQRELAKRLGVSTLTIQNWELGLQKAKPEREEKIKDFLREAQDVWMD